MDARGGAALATSQRFAHRPG